MCEEHLLFRKLCHRKEENNTSVPNSVFGTDFGTLHWKNIRTYEKIREDSRRGRIVETRINTGFEKSWEDTRGYEKVIKILFVCHGSIWLNGQKPSIYAGLRLLGQDFYQRFINIRIESFSMRQITEYILVKPGAYLWIHCEWEVSAFFIASRQITYASGRPYLTVQFRQKRIKSDKTALETGNDMLYSIDAVTSFF